MADISVTALALGLAVSLPLAIISRNRPVLRGALLGLAGVVQTVPGLALLALPFILLARRENARSDPMDQPPAET